MVVKAGWGLAQAHAFSPPGTGADHVGVREHGLVLGEHVADLEGRADIRAEASERTAYQVIVR
jgi:hypothetical protein